MGIPIKSASSRKHSRQQGAVLDKWLASAPNTFYPSKDQKMQLATATEMTYHQVNRWFANKRRKLKITNSVSPSSSERVFSPDGSSAAFSPVSPCSPAANANEKFEFPSTKTDPADYCDDVIMRQYLGNQYSASVLDRVKAEFNRHPSDSAISVNPYWSNNYFGNPALSPNDAQSAFSPPGSKMQFQNSASPDALFYGSSAPYGQYSDIGMCLAQEEMLKHSPIGKSEIENIASYSDAQLAQRYLEEYERCVRMGLVLSDPEMFRKEAIAINVLSSLARQKESLTVY